MKTFVECLKINDQHDERGRFASTGGAGGHDTPAKWLSTRTAKRALDTVVALSKDPQTYKNAVAQAINTAIFHFGQMDQGGAFQEQLVHHEVMHLAQNLKISAAMAKDVMSRGVKAMVEARSRQVLSRATTKAGDPVLAALVRLQGVLDGMDVEKANDNHDERGRFASGDGSGGETPIQRYARENGMTIGDASAAGPATGVDNSQLNSDETAELRETVYGSVDTVAEETATDAEALNEASSALTSALEGMDGAFEEVESLDADSEDLGDAQEAAAAAAIEAHSAMTAYVAAAEKAAASAATAASVAKDALATFEAQLKTAGVMKRGIVMKTFAECLKAKEEPVRRPVPVKQFDIVKTTDDKQMVYGWASVIKVKGDEYTDTQNDRITSTELENATTEFMIDARKALVMHERKNGAITDDLTKGTVVHSFPLTDELMKSLGISSDKEGWIVGVKVSDPEVWKGVKSGKYKSFSIGARIKRRRPAEEE